MKTKNKKVKFLSARVDEKLAKKFKLFLLKKNITLEDFINNKIKETLKK